MADLLVGVVKGLLKIFHLEILEENLEPGEGFSRQAFIVSVFNFLFLVASLASILLISLDRLHATIYLFRHCLIEEWVYFKIILSSWLIALLLTFVLAFLFLCSPIAFMYAFASCIFFTLMILTVSYVIIISTIILTILPWAIYAAIPQDIWSKLSPAITDRLLYIAFVLCYTNFLVNPLKYAIRMEEFWKAAKELVCKRTPRWYIRSQQTEVFPGHRIVALTAVRATI